MSGKRFWLAGLVVLLGLGASRARGQSYGGDDTGTQPTALSETAGAPFVDLGGGGAPTTGQGASNLPPISDWLLNPRSPGCCGAVGQHGPIQTDIYVRTGLVWPTGGGILVHSLKVGWEAEIGGRALFFDPALQHAWTVALSISNVFNPGRADVPSFPLFRVPVKTTQRAVALNQLAQQIAPASPTLAAQLLQINQIGDSTTKSNQLTQLGQQIAGSNPTLGTQIGQLAQIPDNSLLTAVIPELNASVASLNQTYVNVAFGREWYLIGCADCGDHWNWRVGADLGGRYGTAKLEYNEISHHTDVLGGIFLAAHTDVEFPCRCGTIVGGMRTEWGYTWNDILQRQNPSDFQSFSLLFDLGVRF